MIYAFEPNATDVSGVGMVGGLLPVSCVYEEVGNGLSQITLEHPVDEYGKYKALSIDNLLSVEIPVRSVPEIDNGQFVTHIETWTVDKTATKKDRYIYSKNKDGKVLYKCKGGEKLTVVQIPTSSSIKRYKVKYKKVTGWIESESLIYDSETTIPARSDGIESVAPSWNVKPQLFRITSVDVGDDGIVSVTAMHISYDLMYNINVWHNKGSYSLQDALDGILNGCITPHDFTAKTNIQGTHTGALYADYDPITAMLDPDEGLCSKWSAEIVRDNYDIVLLDEAGFDRGMTIEYAKNLTGVQQSTDMSNVCTRIRPIGTKKNGEKLYLTTPDGCIDSEHRTDYSFDRIMTLEVSDASVSDDVSESLARSRMTEAARAEFSGGIDLPTVSLSVEFSELGNDPKYAQYKDLEKVFLYDTVRVIDKRIGIDTKSKVIHITFDCLAQRMLTVELGTLKDMVSTVSGYQISGGISGEKLIYGSVSSGQIAQNAIAVDHIQANSITTSKIAAEGIDASVIKTGTMSAERIDAGTLDAKVGNIVQANIQSADINYAHIADLNAGTGSVDYLFTKDGNAEKYYFEKLGVTSAQILSLMVGLLVLRGNDGKYYEISVGTDANGNVTFEPREYTGTITHDDSTGADLASGGRYVFEDTVDTETLFATNANIADAVVTSLTASKLVASDAFISRLVTRTIIGGASLEDIAKVNTLIRLLPDGGGISISDTDTNTTGEVLIDKESVNIKMNGQTYSRFASKYVEFGNYQLRKSKDGGLVFKMRD